MDNSDFDKTLAHYAYRLIKPRLVPYSILELGCGDGYMTVLLDDLQKVRGHILRVVDKSSENISRVSALCPWAGFTESLFENFEPQHKYHNIIMSRTLEHVKDPQPLLYKMREWLVSYGKLFVVVPNANSWHRRVGVRMGKLKSITDFSERDRWLEHQRVYTKSTLEHELNCAGWNVTHCAGNMIKFLANEDMARLPSDLVAALWKEGKSEPNTAAEIMMECQL